MIKIFRTSPFTKPNCPKFTNSLKHMYTISFHIWTFACRRIASGAILTNRTRLLSALSVSQPPNCNTYLGHLTNWEIQMVITFRIFTYIIRTELIDYGTLLELACYTRLFRVPEKRRNDLVSIILSHESGLIRRSWIMTASGYLCGFNGIFSAPESVRIYVKRDRLT